MSRILIVEDKEQDRYLLRTLLEKSGFFVDAAADGGQALAIARANPPDLVVSDILMPVMDGFTLCREWRKDSLLCAVPFVFYTATYSDPRDEEFALKLGADKFLIKPIDPAILLDAIKEVLSGSPQRTATATNAFVDDGETYFKSYSEALVRKLEDKLELFRTIFDIDPSPILMLSSAHGALERPAAPACIGRA
jgi:DNA-binding response OmpR family regulator